MGAAGTVSAAAASRVHLLGICGTFMGGIAALARELGYRVSGSDQAVYPPMSTQLEALGIDVLQGYAAEHLRPEPELVVIGNALSRGNPAVEYVLDAGMAYTSGPEWLAEHVLKDRWVLAVAGTHGKTSTASMLAWILEATGRDPGFLIGGVPGNFSATARLGGGEFFVVEADEYDTAFFDKRSKFVHYRPRSLIINNLEYDHADIFPDLAAIQRQFHHLLRTVPSRGRIIRPRDSSAIDAVVQLGCWSSVTTFGTEPDSDWRLCCSTADCGAFTVHHDGLALGAVEWPMLGVHNASNAVAAIAAAAHAGVDPVQACAALSDFRGVKRRLELLAELAGIKVFDDFAHHPTAIAATLRALRARVGAAGRIIAVLEPRSNTMRLGMHRAQLATSLICAEYSVLFEPPDLPWDLAGALETLGARARVFGSYGEIVDWLSGFVVRGDHVVFMSNGAFGDIQQAFIDRLGALHPSDPGSTIAV